MRRIVVRSALAAVLGAGVLTGLPVTAATDAPAVGSSVYVTVSVATLWVSPDSPRRVDAPALARPVHLRAWLRAMSTELRRGLVGRVETQALYGERLVVTGVSGHWLHVVAVRQSTHRDSRGYPGWVPLRQVTAHRPAASPTVATVLALTTQMSRADGTRALRLSYGTRLPVRDASPSVVTVVTPTGRERFVPTADVVLAARAEAARPGTVRSVMRSAFAFRGVPYLWGGRSGFAVDCSGFTGLVYGVHGVRLPRDADDQAEAGRWVSTSAPQRGDLAFFAPGGGPVTHVGFVAGDDRLLQAPASGQTVSVTRLSGMSGLVAVRRFL